MCFPEGQILFLELGSSSSVPRVQYCTVYIHNIFDHKKTGLGSFTALFSAKYKCARFGKLFAETFPNFRKVGGDIFCKLPVVCPETILHIQEALPNNFPVETRILNFFL